MPLSRLVPFALVVAVAALVGCDDCRRIETRRFELDCSVASSFRGELHLDSAATWRSFLSDRCLPGVAAADIDALVAGVDFDVDAILVARGERASNTRCIEQREAERVDVCGDGLRVIFDDVETSIDTCAAGDWTVALLIARADLRDAIADDGDDDVTLQ